MCHAFLVRFASRVPHCYYKWSSGLEARFPLWNLAIGCRSAGGWCSYYALACSGGRVGVELIKWYNKLSLVQTSIVLCLTGIFHTLCQSVQSGRVLVPHLLHCDDFCNFGSIFLYCHFLSFLPEVILYDDRSYI